MKSSTYYFHVKANILADFQICISVPLIFFFAIAPNASPLSYAIQSEEEARVNGTKNVF